MSGRQGGRACQPFDQPYTLQWGVATLPVTPLPSVSKWGKIRGQLISQGLLTIFAPPHTLKKMSSCHVAITSCPTVVPGMFVVGCYGDGRRGHYPGSCGEGDAPPPRPTVGEEELGGLPRGPFQAECVWSLMPQIPQGPQTSVCGKESQPPTQTSVGETVTASGCA